MDIRKIKKLIALMESSEISELEIHEGESSIRMKRGVAITAQTPMPVKPEAPTHLPVSDSKPNSAHNVVKSPMVGTFYAGSSTDAQPFVSVGQHVEKGDTLCIIEAMKIFNQIKADVAGTILSIEQQNGDPVEFGDPLFVIK